MLEAFEGKSGDPDFLTYFKYVEADKLGSQAKF